MSSFLKFLIYKYSTTLFEVLPKRSFTLPENFICFADVQYISQQPGKKGQNGTFAAKDNPAYVEENEVTPSTSSASCSSEPPVDYADQEASCTLGKENEDSMRSEEAEPQQGSERKGSGSDKNFPMGVMATYPKFTGWNKDLYSDEAGLPPPPPPIATDISHDKTSAENQS